MSSLNFNGQWDRVATRSGIFSPFTSKKNQGTIFTIHKITANTNSFYSSVYHKKNIYIDYVLFQMNNPPISEMVRLSKTFIYILNNFDHGKQKMTNN